MSGHFDILILLSRKFWDQSMDQSMESRSAWGHLFQPLIRQGDEEHNPILWTGLIQRFHHGTIPNHHRLDGYYIRYYMMKKSWNYTIYTIIFLPPSSNELMLKYHEISINLGYGPIPEGPAAFLKHTQLAQLTLEHGQWSNRNGRKGWHFRAPLCFCKFMTCEKVITC